MFHLPSDCCFVHQAIEGSEVSKNIFDPAQVRVLSLMESESLSTFLSSDTLKELRKRIQTGEMDKLLQEDIESVKDIMSKEVSESKPKQARPSKTRPHQHLLLPQTLSSSSSPSLLFCILFSDEERVASAFQSVAEECAPCLALCFKRLTNGVCRRTSFDQTMCHRKNP